MRGGGDCAPVRAGGIVVKVVVGIVGNMTGNPSS